MAMVLSLGVACRERPPLDLVQDRVAFFETVAPRPPRTAPLPASEALALLESEPFEVREIERLKAGVTGAARATIVFPRRDRTLEVKWKVVPRKDADGWNNTPRKELAAYAVQRWFLERGDYVVPPVAVRCVPLARYHRFDPEAKASIEGAPCVLGMLSLWLQDVEVPETLWDAERFLRDPHYAAHRADFNLFTYLIEHRDGRAGNFLVPTDPTDFHVFSVDNGIAFGGLVYNYLVTNWDTLHVPALRRAAVERLRGLDAADLDALLVVAELRADADGVLRYVPPGPVVDPEEGTRVGPGLVQLGLTRAEVDAVAERRTRLLARIDRGEIPLF
jgi:hypothetical protein